MTTERAWLHSAADLLAEPDPGPTPFIVSELIVDQAIGAIVGPPKAGKTFLLLDLAIAIATGLPALGRYGIPKQGPVVIVLEESGRAALHRRLDALARGRAIKPEQLRELHFAANARVRLNEKDWQGRLVETAKALRPRAIFLDPLARLKGANVDESSQRELGPVLDFIRDLRDASGAAVVYVHHVGHAGGHQRGTSDLEAYWESKITLTRNTDGTSELTAEHREAATIIARPSMFGASATRAPRPGSAGLHRSPSGQDRLLTATAKTAAEIASSTRRSIELPSFSSATTPGKDLSGSEAR